MINFLPPKEKEEILQEENWKLIMILGILLSIFLISLSLILFSIKISIFGEVEAQKLIFEAREKEFTSPQTQDLQEDLIAFNKNLLQLDSFYQNQLDLTEISEEISQTIPSGIYLTNLSIIPQRGEEKIINCNLVGFSPTRENLLIFKENLEKETEFHDIYFPSSSWVKTADINFTISFKIIIPR